MAGNERPARRRGRSVGAPAKAGTTGRKLWIHIGSHKTGTTTLQSALEKAQRDGQLGGWRYVHPPRHSSLNMLVRVRGEGARMHARIKLALLDRMLPAEGDCIISTEMLFWVHDAKQIQALADRLRGRFDEIRIVAYLRRQDALALSHRKQVVMGMTAFHFYGAQIQALPEFRPHMRSYFNYAAKLAAWEKAFGRGSVIVRRFQRGDLAGGDTVQDFFGMLGLDQVPQVKPANQAWSRSQLLAGLWLRSSGHPREKFVARLLKIDDPEPLRPARADAEAFLARFARPNAVLARKYDPNGPAGFFDSDLSAYPDTANDDPARLDLDFEALEREILASRPRGSKGVRKGGAVLRVPRRVARRVVGVCRRLLGR